VVPAYLRKKHLNDPSCYLLPSSFLNARECAFKTLTTRNVDSYNAWTMIVLMFIVAVCLGIDIRNTNWQTILFSCAILIHAPFSIGHHIFRAYSLDMSRIWQRRDVIMIYVHQLLVHIALSSKIPSSISAITSTIFAVMTFQVWDKLKKTAAHEDSTKLARKYLWVFALNIVPLLMYYGVNLWFIAFLGIVYTIYIGKYPERITRSLKYGYSHEYMHISLLVIYLTLRNQFKTKSL
jgi:hypothetical protein